jgi:hypothetical protein
MPTDMKNLPPGTTWRSSPLRQAGSDYLDHVDFICTLFADPFADPLLSSTADWLKDLRAPLPDSHANSVDRHDCVLASRPDERSDWQ